MRTKNVIELARKRDFEFLGKELYEKGKNIRYHDETYLRVKSSVEEINKYIMANCNGEFTINTNFDLYISDSCEKQLNELEYDFNEKRNCISKKYEEIKAMVSGCDTYEQEMDVLKAYRIVDVDGKMIV